MVLFVPDQLPAPFVNHAMVPAAQKNEVGKVGLASAYPVKDVMAVAAGCFPLASRPLAVTVADPERRAQRVRDDALGATHVDHRGILIEENPGDAAVA